MITVSECCHKEIINGTKHEYPLGGTTWYETFKAIYCSGCGKECETEEVVEDAD